MSIKIKSIVSCIIGVICGLLIGPLLSSFGILVYQKGVDYYAQVHLSFWNSLIHTIFMPFTYLGFNLSIPALLHIKDSWYIQLMSFIMFMTHYCIFDPITGLFAILYYYPFIKFAYKIYMRKVTSYYGYIWFGLIVSSTALIIQEYYGHYIGGDNPSRLNFTSIFNAILYAKFYAVQHLVRFYNYF